MRIVWSSQSRNDLKAIRAFIARDSPITASHFIRKLKASVTRLRIHPESGHIVDEFSDIGIREILFGQYRIMYECGVKRIEILAVYHGARLLGDTQF